ncbi:RNase adapter RapZ [Aurantivibrio plasticivorans]
MRLIVISGHSGSGKSTALHLLEDAGFTCVDNLPASLLPQLVDHIKTLNPDGDGHQKFAISIDARNTWQDLKQFPQTLTAIEALGVKCEIVFLDAKNNILIQRYSETRRKHPLSDENTDLKQAIHAERSLLEPIADLSDLVIDTTSLNLHELRDLIKTRVLGADASEMSILFESFGFKHGIPADAEIVYDVRCLPNPYWKPHLRNFNGLEEPIETFLSGHDDVQDMLADITAYLERWLPKHQANNRSYITIAIGCTGGQHRSVYLSNQLFTHFSKAYKNVLVRHRELNMTDHN